MSSERGATGLDVVLILDVNHRDDELHVALVESAGGLALPRVSVGEGETVEEAAARLLRGLLGDGATVELKSPNRLLVGGVPTTVESLYAAPIVPGLVPVAVEVMAADVDIAAGVRVMAVSEAAQDVPEIEARFLRDYPARKRYRNPTPTCDIIIRLPDDRIVLVWRNHIPLGWAIPGGFAEYRLRYEETARKEALEEVGLHVTLDGICGVYSDKDRDAQRPWANTASVVYAAHVEGQQTPRPGSDAGKLGLFEAEELRRYVEGEAEEARGELVEAENGRDARSYAAVLLHEAGRDLCFDHAKILRDYFARWPEGLLGMEEG